MVIIPLLNPPDWANAKGRKKMPRVARRRYRKNKPIPWVAAARKAKLVDPKGKVLSKAQAIAGGVTVKGHITKADIRRAGFVPLGEKKWPAGRYMEGAYYHAGKARSGYRSKKGKKGYRKKPGKAKATGPGKWRPSRSWVSTYRRGTKVKKGKRKGMPRLRSAAGMAKKKEGIYAGLRTYRPTLYAGTHPPDYVVDRILEGGFGAREGGVVSLNKPRRRRKRRRRKNPALKRDKKGRFLKKRKNPRRKRKAKAKRKVARKRYRRNGVKKNPPKRRRRMRRNAKGKFLPMKRNPKRRRKVARKAKRRRRRRVYALNPTSAIKSKLKMVLGAKWVPKAAHTLIGMGVAYKAPDVMGRYIPISRAGVWGPWVDAGLGVLGLSVASGLAEVGSRMIQRNIKSPMVAKCCAGIGTNMMAGGLAFILGKLVLTYFHRAGSLLPPIGGGYNAGGMSDWMELSGYPGQYGGYAGVGDPGGLGMVTDPESLVAGESLARQTNEFHGLQGSGGYPVPVEDIRGLGDWVELAQDSSLAMTGFSPGSESF